MVYADKDLTCRDCGTPFTFTNAEQELFAQKGFTNEPSRCPECRAARKSQRSDDGERGDSNRGGTGGAGYARAPREMFSATCSACGQTARVPFEPRTEKPVYCSSCFEQHRTRR